ncbi:MAG: VCBS repeat-containing protein [Deltaproteobacteria bacterium]|nr:VCBS repeat-containing protein [Deltaproteobacteria bacterium]
MHRTHYFLSAAVSVILLTANLSMQGCSSQPLAVGGPYLTGELQPRRLTNLPLGVPIEIEIQLYNSNEAHSPLVGYTVTLSAEQATIVQPSAQTDENGITRGYVQTNNAGVMIISAYAHPQNLDPVLLPQLTLEFASNPGETFIVSTPANINVERALAIGAGDINKDGIADLIVLNEYPAAINIWLGGSTISHTPRQVQLNSQPRTMAIADFNGDGSIDFAVARQGTTALSSILEIIVTNTNDFSSAATYDLITMTHALAAFDLDGASPSDLITAEAQEEQNLLELFTFSTNTQAVQTRLSPINITLTSKPVAIAAAPINASDNFGDVVVAIEQRASILKGNANNLDSEITSLKVGGTPTAIAIGDVNLDDRTDVVVTKAVPNVSESEAANQGANQLVVFLSQDGEFSFNSPATMALSGAPTAVAIADVTDDDIADVLVLTQGNETGSGRLEVFVQAVEGTLHASEPKVVADDPLGVVVADFNGDTHPDIAVVSYGQPVKIFYGQ